jgi:putative oxidoreductase
VVNLALLVLRAIMGSLMLGHGAQKLFGWWGGYGLEGTSGWLESMGLRPGKAWAVLAGGSEFGGGVLSLLGLASPLGPLGVIGAMAMATRKAHWGNPIWVTEGGPELPVTNISIATALMLAGPGKYSLDRALGIRLPRWVALLGLAVIAITVYFGAQMEPPAQEEESPEEAREELQAEDEDQQQT